MKYPKKINKKEISLTLDLYAQIAKEGAKLFSERKNTKLSACEKTQIKSSKG